MFPFLTQSGYITRPVSWGSQVQWITLRPLFSSSWITASLLTGKRFESLLGSPFCTIRLCP
jgi:hypothetical protein